MKARLRSEPHRHRLDCPSGHSSMYWSHAGVWGIRRHPRSDIAGSPGNPEWICRWLGIHPGYSRAPQELFSILDEGDPYMKCPTCKQTLTPTGERRWTWNPPNIWKQGGRDHNHTHDKYTLTWRCALGHIVVSDHTGMCSCENDIARSIARYDGR